MDMYAVRIVLKNPSGNAGNVREVGSIPGLGRSPGGGHGNPLQHFCLEKWSLEGHGPWGCKESHKTE